MELLTEPDLLFLDEPTSGLDPNLDREVMEFLRDLAHGTPQTPNGRTVVVITHSTTNLDKANLVLLLAPGVKSPTSGLRTACSPSSQLGSPVVRVTPTSTLSSPNLPPKRRRYSPPVVWLRHPPRSCQLRFLRREAGQQAVADSFLRH